MVNQIWRSIKPQDSVDDLMKVISYFKEKNIIHSFRKVGVRNGVPEFAAVLFTKVSAQAAFQRFSDVLLVDTTYGTNEY